MESIIKKNIPFNIELDSFLESIKLDKDHKAVDKIKEYINEANQIGNPKAMYRQVFIDEIKDNKVKIDDQEFDSKIMSVNLKDVHKVILYIVTCGEELNDWAKENEGDMLENYWLSMIQEEALKKALEYVLKEIDNKYLPGLSSKMNPGSLVDWSITEQKKLFKLMGNPKKEIGVKLTESSLMLPQKSVSGLVYPTETAFENCQVCPRKNCPTRSAPYDQSLFEGKYDG
ncbi:MAG: vitamin B12 dependent-methionine synthase activation domain-containing protein [Halanaerobiales bacterium]|nr:vitamin B12 dependent-methionine synthase activation domain-containing protein [Halanaerobiales bacterium]